MSELVEDGRPTPPAQVATGPVEGCFDAKAFDKVLGHRLEDLPPQASDPGQQRADAPVYLIDEPATTADPDVHLAVAVGYRLDELTQEVVREVEDVAIDKDQNRSPGVYDSNRHGDSFAVVVLELDRPHPEGLSDLGRAVVRAVRDHDDLVHQLARSQHR